MAPPLVSLAVFIAFVALSAIVVMVRRRAPAGSEAQLARLDRVLAERGLKADIFIDTKPVELLVRDVPALDGPLAFAAGGVVPEAIKRLSQRSHPYVREGVLHLALDEREALDVERVATDIDIVVDALRRRASEAPRELSSPAPIATPPAKRKASNAEGPPTGAPIAVPLAEH